MRRLLAAFALSVALPRSPAPFVVHEWGTFTYVQGSDGTTLEGLSHDESDLPSFVRRRDEAPRSNNRTKMETPVTYFYTPVAREVGVSVGFPSGVFTHWYPGAREFAPALADETGAAPPLGAGNLSWGQIRLIPPDEFEGRLPDVEGKSHYLHARDVDAAFVRVCALGDPYPLAEHERFLFYRGVGTMGSPLSVRTTVVEGKGGTDVRLEARNDGRFDLEHVYALVVLQGRATFSYTQALRPGETRTLRLAVDGESPDLDETTRGLQRHLASSLELLGLYEKEAWAMVRTWTESYFQTEGVRVLFALPRSVTDAALPLLVDPAPDSMVRVMIGRVECVTPTQEFEVRTQVERLASEDPAVVAAARKRLLGMGRVAEPLLRREPDSKRVKELLASFHPSR